MQVPESQTEIKVKPIIPSFLQNTINLYQKSQA